MKTAKSDNYEDDEKDTDSDITYSNLRTWLCLYSRCADHTASGDYLGSLVTEGVEKQSDCTRLGYMSMADGRMVIGISRSDKVKDYVMERCAIGRTDDQLYYIATRHMETLWDFADAL